MKTSHWLGMAALSLSLVLGALAFQVAPAQGAYQHMGEADSPNFLAVYPDKAGRKLDSCNVCHNGGSTQSGGKATSVGSCQWCHQTYGYDGKGDITATLNPYGKDYLAYGRSAGAIASIAALDSDEDGYSNAGEITAARYPGDAKDDPTKVPAPFQVLSREDLEKMPQHTQFLLMNASKSTDTYSECSGVAMEELLKKMVLPSATGITVFSPDGFAQYHPLNPEPNGYQVYGTYPQQTFYYDDTADIAKNKDGWADYSSPAARDRQNGSPIVNPEGLKLLLAYKRDGKYLDAGVLNAQNKLDGEGPFRIVPPQLVPGVPDQRSSAADQSVKWPYDAKADHNAGFSTRTTTIIRVEPLPAGTTDIDLLEAGWNYVDQNKIVIYGAIDPRPTILQTLDGMASDVQSAGDGDFRGADGRSAMFDTVATVKQRVTQGDYAAAWQSMMEGVVGQTTSGKGGMAGPVANRDLEQKLYWSGREVATLLKIGG